MPSFTLDQRAGDRGVDVAHDDNGIRRVAGQYRLEPLHDFSRLHGVRARADFQIDIRARNAELLEKQLAHPLVVVLARVDEPRRYIWPAGNLPHQGRHLHKVGPRPGDDNKLHALLLSAAARCPSISANRASQLSPRTDSLICTCGPGC